MTSYYCAVDYEDLFLLKIDEEFCVCFLENDVELNDYATILGLTV
jgi:hypothetical protein